MQFISANKKGRLKHMRILVLLAWLLPLAALVSGFVWWPRTPTYLGNAGPAETSRLVTAWKAGEVVALVRHTERCDRSENLCLGPADGITQVGSAAATAVGQGFTHLGMDRAQVLSSPMTRTAQTAHFMFGHDAATQEWLATCGPTLRNDVVAHKVAQHNLVLVTHSGCISDFEKQTGFPHAATAEYGSALFVRIGGKGQLEVLGIVNADTWPQLSLK